MTSQELGKLAKEGKIKLEDLDIEDILKFGELGFINPTLCEYFNLSSKEVGKIRRKKGVQNADFENFIRNMIALLKYIKDNHPFFPVEYFPMMVNSLVDSSIIFKRHRDYCKKEINKIDWINMNPYEEIEKKKIDVENREKTYLHKFYPHIDNLAQACEEEFSATYEAEEVTTVERLSKKSSITRTVNSIPRNSHISENALKKSNYKCELNTTHDTFIKRSNNKPYMEPHHLIPLEFQDMFEYSLDVEANIVSLCSNCHNEIHYGVNYKKLLEKLYKERIYELTEYGLYISLEDLYKMYSKNYVNI